MRRPIRFLSAALLLLCLTAVAFAQTTGTLSGTVQDEKGGAVPGASVTARHVETNVSRSVQTDSEGRYRLTSMPVGHYEITVESQSFAKYVQTGVELLLNQDAVVDAVMRPAGVEAVVNVTENASLLNTTNVEVGTRFDERRLSELPRGVAVMISASNQARRVRGRQPYGSSWGATSAASSPP